MKNLAILVVSLFALAACGGGGGGGAKAELVKACVDDGQSQTECSCMVDAMADMMGEGDLNKLVEYAKTEDEAAAQELIMSKVMADPDKAMKFGTAMSTCSGS